MKSRGENKAKSTYKNGDVILLLKDITGKVFPLKTETREKLLQSGVHYCEMLPEEYKPTKQYMDIYEETLDVFAEATAKAVSIVSEKIYKRKKGHPVIISLARAGTPVGVLIKHYLREKYGVDVPHYSVSIIRGRGIDKNAMKHILENYDPEDLQFVDGWTGKGAIFRELEEALKEYPKIDVSLAVVADPAGITELCGTHDDILIPSSCLNSTVSGLVSRTFLRSDVISETDFHGAAFYENLKEEDRTYEFIDRIEKEFQFNLSIRIRSLNKRGIRTVEEIKRKYGVADINFIKPGIGETTRVLLRRVPWKILVDERYKDSAELRHIFRLAKEKNVEIELTQLSNYKCIGIIKDLADV